ncbi:MAG: type II toxin-antitoxin system prevent-host-death family antitoxin [Deltaproteobacteria bacterium]|nr:type II toxin-antitoxin system prevent-host-death family antitoxin [Deltaproteobacteria bacterium]
MKKANVATLRSQLSRLMKYVEKGNELEIRKRNVPIAKIVPIRQSKKNRTQLGVGKNSARVKGDLNEPLISEADWEMLEGKRE